MKKILMIALAMVIGFGANVNGQSKQTQKQEAEYVKQAEKMAKKRAKELKKEKWENSSSTDLETCLKNYYLETNSLCGGTKRAQEHTVTDASTISIAEKRLLLDAQAAYAQEVETLLTQTITGQTAATSTDELSTYIANIAAKSKHEFNGDVQHAFMIYKTNADGKSITARAYYVIDANEGQLRVQRIAGQVEKNAELSKVIEDAATGK